MDDGERGRFPVLSTRVIVAASMVVGLAAVLSLMVLLWAFGRGTDQNKTQLDAVRTAASIALGTGGAAALLLAARRQQTAEQVAADTRHDASERRVTELYTKAADQLGSDKAPVRLAGLYALERLAQDNPEQRPTIVNVICAYLRMPYTPPTDPTLTPDTATDASQVTTANAVETAEQRREQQEQERQVRLTAQRILAVHLRPDTDDQGRPTNPKYWPEIELDLTAATLLHFDLSGCHIHRAEFDGAQFSGTAMFDKAQFSGDVWFDKAQFKGKARFDKAQFNGNARFDGTQFSGGAWFAEAQFNSSVRFDEAQFSGYAGFGEAQFSGDTEFINARFVQGADLDDARARVDVNESVQRTWPDGWVVQPPTNPEDGQLHAQVGTWGYLVRTAVEADQPQ